MTNTDLNKMGYKETFSECKNKTSTDFFNQSTSVLRDYGLLTHSLLYTTEFFIKKKAVVGPNGECDKCW